MNNQQFFKPQDIVDMYGNVGVVKCRRSVAKTLVLAMLAGALIAFAGAATNTLVFTFDSVGIQKLLCGLIFPFGLIMVILLGAELFTGNSLMVISLLQHRITVGQLAKNWLLVFVGNFVGALFVAGICVFGKQFDLGSGELATFTMNMAAAKCSISPLKGFLLGVGCNILVCIAVLCAMSSSSASGKILGAFVPVSLFVFCGFEHCIANMYYISAGILAKFIPSYVSFALEAEVTVDVLTWSNFLLSNLVPVTLGNIVGGMLIGLLMYLAYDSHRSSTN